MHKTRKQHHVSKPLLAAVFTNFDFALVTGVIGVPYFISDLFHIQTIEHIEFKGTDKFTDILIFS